MAELVVRGAGRWDRTGTGRGFDMTTLGKILVFANLAFSVVTSGLIIMVYAKRTDWKTAYDKVSNNVTVAQKNAETYMFEADEAKRRADELKTRLEKQHAQAKVELDRREQDLK